MGLDIYFVKRKHRHIGYFRKVNFLCAFFEKHGFDVDAQTPLVITKAMAEELLDKCNQVLEEHDAAEALLPTMGGFFFGSTDYNEYYFKNVEDVRDWVQDTLLPQFDSLADDEDIYFETWF